MSIKNNQHKFKENPKKLVLALLTAGIVSVGLIAMQSTTPALATSTDNFATQVFQSGFADLVEKVKPAVVNISTRSTASGNTADMRQFQFSNPRFREYFGQQFDDKKLKRKTRSLGSGFIIDHKGLVVTNYHVVAKADEIEVILDDGTKLPATLIGSDQKTDLALLKVEHDKPLPQVAFGDDDLSRVGDWVIAIGNPFGLGGTTTTGIISARGRNINSGPFDDFIQIDAPINRGNSGGPLFNMRGEVIGINSAIYSPTGGSVGIGFAIPSDLAESVVDDLRDHGLVQRAWLGVQIQSVTKDIAASLQLNTAHGALVTDIVPDSPAAKSALKPGDVIVNFNGHEISKMRDLPIVVAQSDINRELKVLAFRNGKKISLDVRLDQAEVEKLAGTSHPEKPSLGLALAPISDEIRQRMKLSAATTGVLITNVKRNSPAAVKGLQPGDIIESIGSSIVSTPGDVVEMLDSARDNQEEAILLRINRRGADRYVALKLG